MTEPKKSRRASTRPPKAPEAPPYPRVYETYQRPDTPRVQNKPSCFNGIVRIRRYEVTIRRIEEPVEVLRERLLRLWRESERNGHLTNPMYNAARELGIQDPREFLKFEEHGRDYKKRGMQ